MHLLAAIAIALLIFSSASGTKDEKHDKYSKDKRGVYGENNNIGLSSGLPLRNPDVGVVNSGVTTNTFSAASNSQAQYSQNLQVNGNGVAPNLALTPNTFGGGLPIASNGQTQFNQNLQVNGNGIAPNLALSPNAFGGVLPINSAGLGQDGSLGTNLFAGAGNIFIPIGETRHTHITRKFAVPIPQPYGLPIQNDNYVPYSQPIPVPVQNPIPVQVPQAVPVPVDRPYPVAVDQPVPVPYPFNIPVAVQQNVAFPVPQPVPVAVQQFAPFGVPQNAQIAGQAFGGSLLAGQASFIPNALGAPFAGQGSFVAGGFGSPLAGQTTFIPGTFGQAGQASFIPGAFNSPPAGQGVFLSAPLAGQANVVQGNRPNGAPVGGQSNFYAAGGYSAGVNVQTNHGGYVGNVARQGQNKWK